MRQTQHSSSRGPRSGDGTEWPGPTPAPACSGLALPSQPPRLSDRVALSFATLPKGDRAGQSRRGHPCPGAGGGGHTRLPQATQPCFDPKNDKPEDPSPCTGERARAPFCHFKPRAAGAAASVLSRGPGLLSSHATSARDPPQSPIFVPLAGAASRPCPGQPGPRTAGCWGEATGQDPAPQGGPDLRGQPRGTERQVPGTPAPQGS